MHTWLVNDLTRFYGHSVESQMNSYLVKISPHSKYIVFYQTDDFNYAHLFYFNNIFVNLYSLYIICFFYFIRSIPTYNTHSNYHLINYLASNFYHKELSFVNNEYSKIFSSTIIYFFFK